ncbi:ATP-binding protein [Chloroflexota bacterium]
MKEVVVLSGKGGTGKTSIVGSFAVLARDKVLADCDVDAADLHLLLDASDGKKEEFWSGQVASIDRRFCTRCGVCEAVCRFDAVKNLKIDPLSCEGCGFCSRVCPERCISMKETMAGHWFVSETRYGPLVHARLEVAKGNSGKLVTVVRSNARELAGERDLGCIIVDGPPGVGCPVISSLSGIDLALLVTEPTLSGMHDLERITGLCRHFSVPALACINKHDLNEENTRHIEDYCSAQGIELAAKIPFDNAVTEALVQGLPLVEHCRNGVALQIEMLWHGVSAAL